MEHELNRFQKTASDLPGLVKTKIQLYEIFKTFHKEINRGLPYDEVLSSFFKELSPIIPFDRIGIALIENDSDLIRFHWVKSNIPVKWLNENYFANYKTSSLRKVIEEREPRIINNLEEYYIANPGSLSTDLALRDGIRSSLTCPIINEDKPIGVVFFSSTRPYTYGKEHVEVFKEIAEEISLLIDKHAFRSLKTGEQSFISFLRNMKPVCEHYLSLMNKMHIKAEHKLLADQIRDCFHTLDNLIKTDPAQSNGYPVNIISILNIILRKYELNDKRIRVTLSLEEVPQNIPLKEFGLNETLENFIETAISASFPYSSLNIKVKHDIQQKKLSFEFILSSIIDINLDLIPVIDQYQVHKFSSQEDEGTIFGFWITYQA